MMVVWESILYREHDAAHMVRRISRNRTGKEQEMQAFIGSGIGIIVCIAMGLFMLIIFNRSRCTREQAAQLSGCSEQELRDLIKARLLSYRRQYVLWGPYTLDVRAIAQARADYKEITRLRAETDAMIRKQAEELATQIQETKRLYQARVEAQQEELERMRRVHEEILKRMRAQLNLIPPAVAQAFHVLDLPHDAPFSEIRQRYRTLAKRFHPDTGGDPQRFISINEAYTRIITWIDTQA